MNIVANTLGFLRLVAVIPAVICILTHNWIAATAIVIFAMFSDVLDGHLARKKPSQFGAVLDLTADKVFICLVLFAAGVHQPLLFWIAVTTSIREFVVMGLRLYAASNKKLVTPFLVPSWLGKIKASMYYLGLTVYLFGWTFGTYLLLAAVGAGLWSVGLYTANVVRELRTIQSSHPINSEAEGVHAQETQEIKEASELVPHRFKKFQTKICKSKGYKLFVVYAVCWLPFLFATCSGYGFRYVRPFLMHDPPQTASATLTHPMLMNSSLNAKNLDYVHVLPVNESVPSFFNMAVFSSLKLTQNVFYLDAIIGFTCIVLSCVVIYLGIHNGLGVYKRTKTNAGLHLRVALFVLGGFTLALFCWITWRYKYEDDHVYLIAMLSSVAPDMDIAARAFLLMRFGFVASSFLVCAAGATLVRPYDANHTVELLAKQSMYCRWCLYAAATLTLFNVLYIAQACRCCLFIYQGAGAIPYTQVFFSNYLLNFGLVYSVVLGATYLPCFALFSHWTNVVIRSDERFIGRSQDDVKKTLAEAGLTMSLGASTLPVLAIFGPIVATCLPQILKALSGN